MVEKAVALQISTHLEKNDLNDVYQSAYKKCHSTETALLPVQNDLLMALDSGSSVFLLMLDLSAAFDTIDHSIMLYTLANIFNNNNNNGQYLYRNVQFSKANHCTTFLK